MASKYTITILYLPLLLSLVYISIEAADKRCYKIPLIKNYDIERMSGYWYAQEVGDLDGDESSRKCLLYSILSDKKKSDATITALRIFNGTSTVGKVEMFKFRQIKNTSEFIVEWKKGQENQSGWTVATDYDTWSALYLCQPEQADKGILFIATREQHPSNVTLEAARNAAKKAGFKMTKPYLKRIDQYQCFN